LVLHPGADHGTVAAVCGHELGEECSQLAEALLVGCDRPDAVGELGEVVRAVDCQCAQQILFVGEVEVERPVRRSSGADDVVDPRGVVSAFGEDAHAGIEQLAHRAPPLGAQVALLCGGPRRPSTGGPGSSSVR
jgi:hypothetical protein